MNASWKLGPALATGNTVVLKPSELTSLTTLRLGALIKEAGFPPGVVNIVPGYGWTAGAAISSHMDIGKISFTGSTNAGRQVMKAAAESNLKKVSLEMGGKGPALVMDDAHLEDALKWTAFGMMYNQGQICYACSRVYVHESVYDLFLSYYKHIMNSFPIGDPFSPTTFNGPVASEAHFNRIMQYIEIGKKEGATLLAGGERWGTEGFFIKPTVFADVTPEMTIVKEEIFGPVVVVAKYKTEEELIKLANDSEFGLTAAVFSRDVTKAITTANAIQAGTVWVNMAGLPDPSMPFGGYKQSGIGRDFGEEALYSYLETKSVHVNLTNKPPF
ncbi:ALDH-like protein [Clavulina sp. PMI_390]|nr:ALDH-like protein [Clavulina sp. PMI_390]